MTVFGMRGQDVNLLADSRNAKVMHHAACTCCEQGKAHDHEHHDRGLQASKALFANWYTVLRESFVRYCSAGQMVGVQTAIALATALAP